MPNELHQKELSEQELRILDEKIAAISARSTTKQPKNRLWLSHHWPDQHAERCFKVGESHVCTRCTALYPLGIVVAALFLSGVSIWPDSWDPLAIYLFAMPGTLAYVGEAVGFFKYKKAVQVITTLVTATAFGKGLGYELAERWSTEFWGPIFVFGFIWFAATLVSYKRKGPKSSSSTPASSVS